MKTAHRPTIKPGESSVNVHFRLPESEYDLTLKHAAAERLELSAWLRKLVSHAIARPLPPGR